MADLNNINWAQVVSVGINGGTLLVLVKFIRQVSRLEFKVDMMWGVFKRRYGMREEDKEGTDEEV